MSFKQMKERIDYGDTVLLHIGYDNMLPIVVRRKQTHQTKFGAIKHDSLVGKEYGSKIQGAKGWIYVLQPTPELWTLSLPHRTQILYSTDISMVIFHLDLKPGSVVAEAGTGSGSLSHALIRTIQPLGHLHTFEFHEERSMKAREEFEQHGLSDFVTVTHRDICTEGFQLDHIADAVFLDLPKPWECIGSAKNAIKKEGGRLCTFSPCIEQVQRSCEELKNHGFTEILTIECLAKNYMIQHAKLQNLEFGDIKSNTSTGISPGSENSSDKDPSVECEVPPLKFSKVEKITGAQTIERKGKNEGNNWSNSCAVPSLAMQGHTGFLTFASLYSH